MINNDLWKTFFIWIAESDYFSFEFTQKLAEESWFLEAENTTPNHYKIHDDYFYINEKIFKN